MRRIILTLILLLPATILYAMDLQTAVDSAMKNNPDLMSQMSTEKAGQYSAEATKNTYYPKISAAYSYAKSTEKAYSYMTQEAFSQIGIQVTYNLFNGFSDKYSYESALKQASAEKYRTEADRQDIKLNVTLDYINILNCQDSIKVKKEAVMLLQNQLKDANLSYTAGLVAKNEVLKVEAELASAKQDQLAAKTALKTAVYELNRITGLETDTEENFAEISETDISPLDYASLRDKMINNRSELKYLLENADATDLSIKSITGGYFPKVDVSAGHYSYGDNTAPYDRNRFYDNETVLSASVSVNLFDGHLKDRQIRKKEAEKSAIIYQIKSTKASMELQLKTAIENYYLAKVNQLTAQKEYDSAAENYRITYTQFKQNVATSTDLINARVMLTRAETGINTAKRSLQSEEAKIKRITQAD